MKRSKIWITLGFVVVLLLGLSACKKDEVVESGNKQEEVQEVQKIEYAGNYIAEDESYISITKDAEQYKIVISIYRLTTIDNGIGSSDEEESLISFVATDAAGNPIGGEIRWETSDKVTLTITNSTWEYLSNGTEFQFERSDAYIDVSREEAPVEEPEETQEPDVPEWFENLQLREDYYDNNLMNLFVEACYPGATYEYIGTDYINYEKCREEYEVKGFDAYQLETTSGEIYYYFAATGGPVEMPVVFEIVDDELVAKWYYDV